MPTRRIGSASFTFHHQDYTEAMKWFRRAANQRDAVGQGWVGFMYRDGNGVPQDYVRAYMWLTLAAQVHALELDAAGLRSSAGRAGAISVGRVN
jgi:TPR repeat protein